MFKAGLLYAYFLSALVTDNLKLTTVGSHPLVILVNMCLHTDNDRMYYMSHFFSTWRVYWIAGIVSFLFFALEAILLLALDVATTYFQAQLIIATSLFGLLLGTIPAARASQTNCIVYTRYCLYMVWTLPLLSLGLVLISFAYPLIATIGLLLVFAPLGFVVSALYRFASPWLLYASELLGAVLGLGYFIAAVPYLRSENALIALSTVAAVSVLVILRTHVPRPAVVILIAVVLASGTGLVSNIYNHHVNLLIHTLCPANQVDEVYTANKVFCTDERGTPYELELSLGSLQNRIDIYRLSNDGFYFTSYSGIRNDVIQPFPVDHYTQDARIVGGLIENPTTLIIGAGAEGVAKVAKANGATDITIVENNPAVLKVWDKNLPYADLAYYPFADTNIVLEDGRSFVANTDTTYDIITMMNTHRSLHVAQFGFPNFIHTKEAYATYYDALTPNGFLTIEEVSDKHAGDEAIAQAVATVLTMLQEQGVSDPRQHVLMYQWGGATKDWPVPTTSDLLYSQLVVKKEPWSPADLAAFRDWAAASQRTEDFMKPANMTFYHTLWSPDFGHNSDIATSSVLTQPFTEDFSQQKILTDLAPFVAGLSSVDRKLVTVFLVASVGLFGIFVVWYRRYSVDYTASWLWYFFLIGVGYMAVEMFLLLWLQLYLGSIFITMVVVIGGLFTSSALASLYYHKTDFSINNLVLRSVLLIALLGVALYFPWSVPSFALNVLLSTLMVTGVGVLLAPFFPYAMQRAEKCSWQYAPILFGINGVALAAAVPATLILVSYTSFVVLLISTAVVYAVALIALRCTKTLS